jgi:hypothetical protein
MARRQIGQDHLTLGGAEPRGGTSLDKVAALINRAELDRLLAGIPDSALRRADHPTVGRVRALLERS